MIKTKEKKLRNTSQRRLVLAAVQKHCDHPNAEIIYDEVLLADPHISRATVYRNLNLLSEQGEIKRILPLNGADRYECPKEEHYHLQCKSCGNVFDVEMECLPHPESGIKGLKDFLIEGHQLFFSGLCPLCKKKASN